MGISIGVAATRVFTVLLLATFFIFIPALTFAQQGSVQPLIVESLDETRLTALQGNTHPMAQLQYDQGAAPASLPMRRMLLVLKRSSEQEANLRQLLEDQQDKSSPHYHQWLTPEHYGEQFGPADNDILTVTTWLQSHGFEVTQVSKGRTVIEFSGTASQVQNALHASIHKYVVNGEEHWANAGDPQIPAALAPAVAGVDSLNNFPRKAQNAYAGSYSELTKQLLPANPNFTGCVVFSGCYGVSPYDFATIYDVLPLWNAGIDGTGQTIAIVGRTNINPQDATNFWNMFGLDSVRAPQPALKITLNGPDPGINGDEAEADIDTQWSGAVAPGATIHLVVSQSTENTDGVDLSALYIVDNNIAAVMSESYGQCELGLGTGGNQFYSLLWEQAAAQGISVFVSTGDNGSAGCDDPGAPAQYGLNVNGIASTAFNAAVGGTDFNQFNRWPTYWNLNDDPVTHASAKNYIPETTWDDSCTNPLLQTLGWGASAEAVCNNSNSPGSGLLNSEGGSGGKSACVENSQQLGSCTAGYSKPSWQSGAGVPNDSLRDLPDVSLFASNGFVSSLYVICQSDVVGACNLNELQGYGGTSVASPAFAGIMALVNQKMGEPQGVPGFVLYKLAASKPTSFHDLTSASTIAMPCFASSPNCKINTTGHRYGVLSANGTNAYSTATAYDLATGLGSVDANNLVNNWNTVAFTPTTTSLMLNSGTAVNITHGQSVNVSIGVNPRGATGDVSLLVSTGPGTSTGQAIDGFRLANGSATGTTSLLPGGTYNVIAHYAGDGNSGGSYSTPPVSVTVAREDSEALITLPTFDINTGGETNSNATTVAYGTPYILRVEVTNSSGVLCNPSPFGESACPSGSLTFRDNGASLGSGTYTLNSEGSTENQLLQFSQLAAGSHTLQATYAGDDSFKSSSGDDVITITPGAAAIVAPSVPSSAVVGSVFSISTTVVTSSLGPAPSGAVTFLANGTPLSGTVTYTGKAGDFNAPASTQAVLFTSLSQAGTALITASYTDNGNYTSSGPSAATSVSVKYAPPFVSINPNSATVAANASLTLTALVDTSSTGPAPTGSIPFVDLTNGATLTGDETYATVTDASGNSGLRATFTFTPAVNMVVQPQFAGDSNYPAAQAEEESTITVTGTDFNLAANPSTLTIGALGGSQNLIIIVGGQSGYSGTINFSSSCTGLPPEATCSFGASSVVGIGSSTLTIATAGPHHVAANRLPGSIPRSLWTAGFAMTFAGIFLMKGPKNQRRLSALLSLLAFAALLAMPACGGGGTGGGGGGGGHLDPGTPAGSYPITITATSGTITHTANFTLVVQ